MLLALLFSHAAYAEEISTDFQNMLTEGKQYSEVFRTMTPASFFSRAADIAFPGIRAAMLLAQKILIYLLFAGGVYILATQPTRQYLGAVPALGFAAVLLPDIINLLADLAAHSESWSRYLMVMVPMLSGLTAAVGYTGTALVYSGSFVGCACLFAAAIRLVLLPVLRLYLAIALTGAIWKRNSLCEAADLFLRILKMAFQGLAVLLGILLGAQSVLAQSADSLDLKTGKFLLASSIPIVGQTASDALGTVVASRQKLFGICRHGNSTHRILSGFLSGCLFIFGIIHGCCACSLVGAFADSKMSFGFIRSRAYVSCSDRHFLFTGVFFYSVHGFGRRMNRNGNSEKSGSGHLRGSVCGRCVGTAFPRGQP